MPQSVVGKKPCYADMDNREIMGRGAEPNRVQKEAETFHLFGEHHVHHAVVTERTELFIQ